MALLDDHYAMILRKVVDVVDPNTYRFRITGQSNATIEQYYVLDIDEVTTVGTTYIGTMKNDGTYLIKKLVESTNTSVKYASFTNNPTTSTYELAWNNRTSLTYDLINNT